ncbi:MAG: PDZ domain-containing protein [Acidimicrobiales bacterium]|nr:PDZ domain-containing protein [Acidimicrobiales bacterium]
MYRQDGYLLTTGRFVDGAEQLVVTLTDGPRRLASVVGVDEHADLAVLAIDIADLGVAADWSRPSLGSSISLVGRPGNKSSIVSGSVRAVSVRERLPAGTAIDGLILTDVPAMAEMSGGAVVGDDGSVVGLVNTMPFEETAHSTGAGAVAAPVVEVIAEQIIADGTVRHAYLGVEISCAQLRRGQEVRSWWRSRLGVEPAGPASLAGLDAGDVITAIGSTEVASVATLVGSLRERRPGELVTLRVHRENVEQVRVRLGSMPSGE